MDTNQEPLAPQNPPEMPPETPAVETLTPSPPTEQSVEQPVPKKRSVLKIVLIIMGSIVLLILIAVGIILYNLQKKGLTLDRIVPKAVPTSTMTRTSPTTNSYHNNAYKFTMPYPKDLKVKESPYGFGVTSVEMRSPNTPADYGPDFQLLVFPKAIGEQIGQDFDKYYAFADNTSLEIKAPTGTTVKFTKVKNRTINNQRAFEFTSTGVPADPEIEASVGAYIEMGTDILVISTGESNKVKLDAMLADFKYPL